MVVGNYICIRNFHDDYYTTRILINKFYRFFPVNYQLQVIDKPLKNVNFKQETAQLTGTVECLDDDVCDEVNMIFRSLDSLEEEYRVVTQGDVTFIYSNFCKSCSN